MLPTHSEMQPLQTSLCPGVKRSLSSPSATPLSNAQSPGYRRSAFLRVQGKGRAASIGLSGSALLLSSAWASLVPPLPPRTKQSTQWTLWCLVRTHRVPARRNCCLTIRQWVQGIALWVDGVAVQSTGDSVDLVILKERWLRVRERLFKSSTKQFVFVRKHGMILSPILWRYAIATQSCITIELR